MQSLKQSHRQMFLVLSVLITFALFQSCTLIQSKEVKAFIEAKNINTVISYEEFIKKYPQSKFITEAKERIDSLLNERNPVFRDARSAKIFIDESYSEAKKVSLSSEISTIVSICLSDAGIKLEENNYDVAVKIKIKGEPLGAHYESSFGYKNFLIYSGASIDGSIMFEYKDSNKVSTVFRGQSNPSFFYNLKEIVTNNKIIPDPDEPPYLLAFIMGSFKKNLTKLILETFGIASLKNFLKDRDIREATAAAATEIKDPRVVELLITALKDEAWDVREATIKVLGKIKDARAVVPLISTLNDKDSCVRRVVVVALGEIKDPRAVGPLVSALKDKDSGVRKAAVLALGEIKVFRAIEPFIFALKDEDWSVRKAAALALEEIKDPRAVESLVLALNDKYSDVRNAVATALHMIDPQWKSSEIAKNAVPAFIVALKDADPNIRYAAAEILGETKDPRAVEHLIFILNDKNSIFSLNDKNSNVRRVAVEALGMIRDPRAVEPLILALKDEDSDVQKAAVKALKTITGLDFKDDQVAWKEWWENKKGEYSR